MERFWRCYDAFFHDLTRPGERDLYIDYTGDIYPCYYKSSSAWRLHLSQSFVLVEFTLTLIFTSFRPGETEYLLATEDGNFIVTEEDEDIFIDMQYYGD
jgi:hypothetical protein